LDLSDIDSSDAGPGKCDQYSLKHVNFIFLPKLSLDYFGWALFILGFGFETVADLQKFSFKLESSNKDKFINTGLWSICRHPNYFGEITLWFGVFFSSASNLGGLQYLSILSPMAVAYLITQMSGIPILDRQNLKKWGSNPDYQNYRKQTAKIIPFVY
jgi:steroid 5-alpha reductase family enzyme